MNECIPGTTPFVYRVLYDQTFSNVTHERRVSELDGDEDPTRGGKRGVRPFNTSHTYILACLFGFIWLALRQRLKTERQDCVFIFNVMVRDEIDA